MAQKRNSSKLANFCLRCGKNININKFIFKSLHICNYKICSITSQNVGCYRCDELFDELALKRKEATAYMNKIRTLERRIGKLKESNMDLSKRIKNLKMNFRRVEK